MKTKGEKTLPEPFELTEKTLAWMAEKHPQIDIDETLERFKDWARQKGVMYADWQAGFKSVVRKAMDSGWRSIVTFRKGREADPTWQPIVAEAKKYGFRDPDRMETPNGYRTAFNIWKGDPRNKPALRIVS